ncbi:MAG TPA: Ig-like domain repeat protein, partial [Terriglobus sp.]
TVTFYDTYNGVVVNLGSAALLSNGLNASYGTLNTTGLRAGTHSIIAVYSGDTAFNKETTAAATVTMGDFAMTFVPSSVTISQGGTGQTTLLVTGVSGYAGAVALGCTAPGGTETTCSVSPASVTAGSTAVLTITTTKPVKSSSARVATGASAAGLVALLLAGGRRRRVAALLVLLLAVGLMSGGCAEDTTSTNGGGGTTDSGTPLGTFTFQVTGAALGAPVAAQRTAVLSVTVQ